MTQALPNSSIAEAEEEGQADKEEEQQQQQAPSPAKAVGKFGRTQAIKSQPPQEEVPHKAYAKSCAKLTDMINLPVRLLSDSVRHRLQSLS